MTDFDFNINPYFDDYDETKQFYRVLYRPSYAVQARELTQQQTILQKQIERFGEHVFEDGSIVTGAQHTLDLDVDYIKVNDTFAGQPINATNFIDQQVVGLTSGAVGFCVHAEAKTDTDPPTIYVKTQSGTFVDGEQIVAQTSLESVTAIATSAIGKGSLVAIDEGVYFIDGFFTFVNRQILVLDKYSNTPSYRIGLTVVEDIITDEDDLTLLDPASGSPNYTAPGAHRYKIELQLSKKALDFVDEIDNVATAKFIEILRVENGIKTKDVNYSVYSDLENSLARRTFDESGNYTVEPFQISIEEDPSDSSKLRIGLEPGKAYVKGYEHRTIATEYISVDKGRDVGEVNNFDINAQYGNYAIVTNLQGDFNPGAYTEVKLLNSNIAGTTAGNFATNTIGTAYIRQLQYDSGAAVPYKYKLYLFGLDFTSGSFKDVQSIWAGTFGDGNAVDIDPVDGQISGDSVLFGNKNNIMLFRTPNEAVQTLRPGGNTDTNYLTQRRFTTTIVGGTGAINVTGANSFFGATGVLSDDVVEEHYTVVITNLVNAGATGLGVGDVIQMTTGGRSVTLSGGNQVATFDVADGAFEADVAVIASVNLNEKGERVKTLTSTTAVGIVLAGDTGDLQTSDIFRVTEIRDVGDGNAVVTDKFTVDNGQRDNIYDHGSIILKAGESVVGPLDVDFEYFTHSGSGYFSVDSYVGIPYEDIPTYESATTGEVYQLRDTLDFRVRRTDASTTLEVPPGGADIPQPNTNVSADYIFYLPRVDKIVLRTNREFDILRGISSLNPVRPANDEDAMSLYVLKIPAYTFDVDNVEVEYIDNRRYTMRDIGRLESRLNNVEYYTALSLLEKETQDRTIVDGVGNELFKTGILVDSFSGHGVGDVLDSSYNCSIDFEERELRAPFIEEMVDFTLDTGSSSGVVENSGIITLSYTEDILCRQPVATHSTRVNPFGVTSWNGTMNITPEIDNWFDTTVSPKVITNAEGENDAWRTDGLTFRTQWNDWVVNWAGKQVIEDPTDQTGRGDIQRETAESSQSNSRQNLRSKYSPQSILRKIGTRTTNESVVPYIRPQQIAFEVRGMRPNTTVYPFFDGVDVSPYVAPTGGGLGDPLVTDSNGSISGTLDIPSSTNIRFRTGERLFRLTDSSTDDITAATTSAERRFVVRGLVAAREDTIVGTRVPIVRRRSVNDAQLLRDPVSRGQISTSNDASKTNWIDPLSQTFVVDAGRYKNGVYITSLDLFFEEKDSTLPITVEIRPTVNGYPHSSLIVPFAQKTLLPSEVLVSEDGSLATPVTFDAPIFLVPGEYAITIHSDSKKYKTYIARIGNNVQNTSKRVTKQPYVGNLFIPQNAEKHRRQNRWNLMFRLRKATFSTSTTGEVILNNVQPSSDVLANLLYTMTSQLNPAGTNVSFYYKAKDQSTGNMDTSWQPLLVDQNYAVDSLKIVEAATADTLLLRATFNTNSEDVSPILDLERMGVVCVYNDINDDSTGETLPAGGSATAKYITRRVTLEDGFEGDGLRVILSAIKPSLTDIKVYYKVLNGEDPTLFDERPWVEMGVTQAGALSVNDTDVIELEYAADGIAYSSFTDFKTFAIKIVMLSSDTNVVPRIRDLRVIALKS